MTSVIKMAIEPLLTTVMLIPEKLQQPQKLPVNKQGDVSYGLANDRLPLQYPQQKQSLLPQPKPHVRWYSYKGYSAT